MTEDVASGRIRIEISPKDGVRFRFRNFTAPENNSFPYSYAELERAHFPPSKLDAAILAPTKSWAEGTENPCLLVQAKFIEGGLLLTCCAHHSVSDAVGRSRLFERWSSHTAASANEGTSTLAKLSPSAFDRSPLFNVTRGVKIEDCPEFESVEPNLGDHGSQKEASLGHVDTASSVSSNRGSNGMSKTANSLAMGSQHASTALSRYGQLINHFLLRAWHRGSIQNIITAIQFPWYGAEAERTRDTNPAVQMEKSMSSPKLGNSYWYFSCDSLQALKDAARPLSLTDPWISTNDVLCALFWRRVSVAKSLAERGFESSTFDTPCDIRARLVPPLHRDYLGNAVVHAHINLKLQELLSTEAYGLYQTAARIRKAISSVDSASVRRTWGLIDSLPTNLSIRYKVEFSSGPDCFITSIAKQAWYNFDWGCVLGKIDRLRYPFLDNDGVVIVHPEFREGGVEVLLCLEAKVLERLKADEVWNSFAEFRS